MKKRPLTPQEISILESNGCRAADWNDILVAEDFSPCPAIHDSTFSGAIELGVYDREIDTGDGLSAPAGISHSRLHNVRVGDNCLVNHTHVSDTDLEDDVVLQRVAAVTRQGKGAFANSSPANVIAEDGARSVPLWRHLTAQTAHLVCHLKNHPAGHALEAMAARDADTLRSSRSRVGAGSRVHRSGKLDNVWLGENAVLEGVAALSDCYVDSSPSAPARLGEGVAAEDCVFLAGCSVTGGARLAHCLVGEGVVMDNTFSAKHSLFFANSEFGLGEAACAMAGPFAVSHHKATLILACQCSFNTFGSASNSSNHHFKLGPRHGGILRRGTRCGSGSYIFWPSDIGAFTTVVGRHVEHLETVDFPFSLLVAKGQTSTLVPGVNLFSSGALRDSLKWRDRDRRSGIARPRDLVNPAIFSPYVMQAMEAGVLLLRRSEGIEVDLRHGGAVIPSSRVKPALRLYDAALIYYVGLCLLGRALETTSGRSPSTDDFVRVVTESAHDGGAAAGRWRDWGGMLLSGADAEAFVAELASGELSDHEAVRARLERIHAAYGVNELAWAARRWMREYGEPTRESVGHFIEKWRKAVRFAHECLARDIGKEYTQEVMYGFGVEGSAVEAFRRVRGEPEDHPLMMYSLEERDRLLDLAARI